MRPSLHIRNFVTEEPELYRNFVTKTWQQYEKNVARRIEKPKNFVTEALIIKLRYGNILVKSPEREDGLCYIERLMIN